MLSQNNDDIIYAGFFVRLAAYIVDCILVGAALLAIRIPFLFVKFINPDIFIGKPLLFKFPAIDILLYILSLVYFVLMTYLCGATLGKKAMNIKVVKKDSEKLSLIDVIYRESIGRYLSGLIIFVGYIMIAVDSKKRGLHDILCDTFVIYDFKKRDNTNEEAMKVIQLNEIPQQDNNLQNHTDNE